MELFESLLIVAGSRTVDDYNFVSEEIKRFIKSNCFVKDVSIISGHARGVDLLGERFAEDNNLNLIVLPAQWEKFGKRAGYLRNQDMADLATHCLVICENNSKGSIHMYNIAKSKGLITNMVEC